MQRSPEPLPLLRLGSVSRSSSWCGMGATQIEQLVNRTALGLPQQGTHRVPLPSKGGFSSRPRQNTLSPGSAPPGHSTIALVAQQSADRRGGHYAHSHDASWDPVFGRSWHRARLFRSADGSFNSGFTVNRRRREYRRRAGRNRRRYRPHDSAIAHQAWST